MSQLIGHWGIIAYVFEGFVRLQLEEFPELVQ